MFSFNKAQKSTNVVINYATLSSPCNYIFRMHIFTQPHIESKVQNYELFVQTFHYHGPFDNKEVK